MPDFHLIGGQIVSLRQVEQFLQEQPADVVIVVGEEGELDEFARQLVDRARRITVVRLIIVPPSLQIRPSVSELGIGELVDILRTLVRTSDSAAHPRLLHTHIASAEPTARARTADSQALKAARLWLDALLKSCIARERSRPSNELPGLTIGRDTVVELLEQENAAAPEDANAAIRWAAVGTAIAAEAHSVPFAVMCERLGLTELERKAFLLCLAPELDLRYQRAFGYLHDNYSHRHATLGLVCALLGDPLTVRGSLAASGGLARWRLLETGQAGWAADEPLRIDRALLNWLLDHRSLLAGDPQLRRTVRLAAWPGASLAITSDADRERLDAQLASTPPGSRLLLAGDEPDAWRIRAEAAALAAGAEPIRISVAALRSLAAGELDDFAARATRMVKLFALVPIIDASGCGPELLTGVESVLLQLSTASAHPIFVIVDAPERSRELFAGAVAILERSTTTVEERAKALIMATRASGIIITREEADRFAATYALPESDVALALGFAQAVAAGHGRAEQPGVAEIADASRRIASPTLPSFARRIEPSFTLTQVVLPEDRHHQLQEIIGNIKYAPTVFGKWRFAEQIPYGRGVTVLFSGPPGTGKTMAAQAIANALGRLIYSVDLAQLPSKYIGETNKNFDIVFGEAERSGAVVQIDEADAFFGKRSEVKDAHDRYANLEVAYLLQRIEAFTGLAILTTNFRQNLDPAFLRRFRFTVDFPVPDAIAREAIWRQCLAGAPLGDDIDYRFIARRLELTGGSIRQITLRAAFAAAAADAPISMKHLIEATRAELSKIGMHQAERELAERAA
ncbi:ATP-binding protein [Bradyrhizobium sp. AZCC 1588]|uniref:ATP-binding protein n=1 Tax=Bradyrhizobium sp. AZCC 1588 TaxID=3117018 RepID=UPI002FEF53A3